MHKLHLSCHRLALLLLCLTMMKGLARLSEQQAVLLA